MSEIHDTLHHWEVIPSNKQHDFWCFRLIQSRSGFLTQASHCFVGSTLNSYQHCILTISVIVLHSVFHFLLGFSPISCCFPFQALFFLQNPPVLHIPAMLPCGVVNTTVINLSRVIVSFISFSVILSGNASSVQCCTSPQGLILVLHFLNVKGVLLHIPEIPTLFCHAWWN